MPIVELIQKKEEGIWNSCDKIYLKPAEERDVSLITSIGYEKLKKDRVKGFCHFKFKANFVVNDIDTEKIALGTSIFVGDAMIQVTAIGKECHSGCPALDKDNRCTLGSHIFFCRVLKEGLVRQHDMVK